MFEKKRISIIDETLPEDEVHFKPLLGLRPGVYLAGLYGIGLGVILFFVLLYPGLSKPGTLVSFTSEPSGGAVRVDGVYNGTAPCEIFIPRGIRQIEIVLPGFEPYQQELDVQGRVFGSKLFPRRGAVTGTLLEAGPGRALLLAASEYGVWSFTGEPTATRQIPQVLSEGAYRSGPGLGDPRELEKILQAGARFTSTKAGLRDLLRAKYLIDNAGLSPSPVSGLHSIEDMLIYLSEVPGGAQWLGASLPPEIAAVLTESSWSSGSSDSPLKQVGRVGEAAEVESLRFWEISAGILVRTSPFPREIPMHSFSIAETPVSSGDWEIFMQAQPEWEPEQSRTLTAKGWATADYLGPGDYAGPAVSGVSWYGAKAYCEWLTTRLGADLADYEIRLPTEAEWEYAAKAAELTSAGPKGMGAGLWEWCADPYAPYEYLPADPALAEEIGSPERSVRGGPSGPESRWDFLETRGSLFPGACSPFGVFRPVLAKKTGTD